MDTKSSRIVNVCFVFNGSSVISSALDIMGIHNPRETGERIKREFVLNLPNVDKDQSLVITMSTKDGKDDIDFMAYDSIGDDFDSRKRAEFTLSLSKVLGPKGWAAYLRGKERPGADVMTPADAEENWREQTNLHNHLADRLKKALERHGLKNIFDDEDSDVERKLIGMFLDYREMARNPQQMLRRLDLG